MRPAALRAARLLGCVCTFTLVFVSVPALRAQNGQTSAAAVPNYDLAGVHPANTYRLADALIKANKRFDMFIVPGARHAFGDASGYVNWLRGDYFSRYLLGTSSESVDIVELNREEQKTGKPR